MVQEIERQRCSPQPLVVTGTSSSLFSTVAPTAPGTLESLETSTILITKSTESSGDDTPGFTEESVSTASTVPSLSTTESPISHCITCI